jgi:hypothetical protein
VITRDASARETIAAGVPLFVMPMGRDQPNNAASAVASGTGLQLTASASARAIASAVERLLAEPSFRQRATTLGAISRAEAGASTAVDELEAIVASRHPSAGGLLRDLPKQERSPSASDLERQGRVQKLKATPATERTSA